MNNFFSIPEYSSALTVNNGRIGFIRLIRVNGIITVETELQAEATLPQFVETHRLYNEIVSLNPNERQVLTKIIEQAEVSDDSYEGLLSAYLPKGMEPESVSLSSMGLSNGQLLINIARNEAIEALTREITQAGLIPGRVGGGVCEIGIALQPMLGKGFTGSVILVTQKSTRVLMYYQGALTDIEELQAGKAHFDESQSFFMNEILRFMVYYWETKQLKEPVKRLVLLPLNSAMTAAFEAQGFTVETLPLKTENIEAYALAYNTFILKHAAIDHSMGIQKHRKNVRLSNRIWQYGLRRVLPVACGALLVLAILFSGLYLFNNRLAKKESSKKARIDHIVNVQEENKKLRKEISEAKSLLSSGVVISGVMQDVGSSMPDGVWLTDMRFSLEQNKRLVLDGVGKDDAGVQTLFVSLEKQGKFKNVRLLFTEKIDRKEISRKSSRNLGDMLIRFSIEMSVL